MQPYSNSYALVIGFQSCQGWARPINPVPDAHEVGDALARHRLDVTYVAGPDAEVLQGALSRCGYGTAGQHTSARVVV